MGRMKTGTLLMLCTGCCSELTIKKASEKAQILLDGGASPDIVFAEKKCTALGYAASTGNHEVVRVLLEAGASISHRTVNGHTALMVAVERGHLKVVRLICDAEADLSNRANDGCTVLMRAADHGHMEVVRELSSAGANVHQKSKQPNLRRPLCSEANLAAKDGMTALHFATFFLSLTRRSGVA